MHMKMYTEEAKKFYRHIYKQVGEERWTKFKATLKDHANPDDDYTSIEFEKFELVLNTTLGLKMNQKQKDLLYNTCGSFTN